MNKPMRMEPDEVRSGGRKVGNSGEDLQQVLDTLKGALAAEGECWGTDEAGQKFAEGYVKSNEDVTGAMSKLADALGTIGDNLKSTADDVEARDRQASEDLDKIRPDSAMP